jgi:hypothetical protein
MSIQGVSAAPMSLEIQKSQFGQNLLSSPGERPASLTPVATGTANSEVPSPVFLLAETLQAADLNSEPPKDLLRDTFNDFVGQTFFSELIKSYRKTQQPAAYFHGGRAEQIFQGQLDQVLSEVLSERTASTIADPMYDLFMLKRQ